MKTRQMKFGVPHEHRLQNIPDRSGNRAAAGGDAMTNPRKKDTPLLDRLREWPSVPDALEAADLIEQLERVKQMAYHRIKLRNEELDRAEAEIEKLEAENKRLREVIATQLWTEYCE